MQIFHDFLNQSLNVFFRGDKVINKIIFCLNDNLRIHCTRFAIFTYFFHFVLVCIALNVRLLPLADDITPETKLIRTLNCLDLLIECRFCVID